MTFYTTPPRAASCASNPPTNGTISGLSYPPTSGLAISNFHATKSRIYKAKTTGVRSPRRRRTERLAIALLDDAQRLSGAARDHAIGRIRLAKQPVAEAKRIVSHPARKAVTGIAQANAVDFSNVQELRVRIIRRDLILDSPQAMYLARMERDIATKGMTGSEFQRRAELLMSEPMKPVLTLEERRRAKAGDEGQP